MTEDTTPVLVGAGQLVQRDAEPTEGLSCVQMMAETSRLAADDTGARVLDAVDLVAVVDILGWSCPNPPRLLSEALSIRPRTEISTSVGGNTPQALVNDLARRIEAGEVGAALIAGANAVATRLRARREGIKLDWPKQAEGDPDGFGDGPPGNSEIEDDYSVSLPVFVYPLFETALRAKRGLTCEQARASIGRLMAPFSEVAAENPYAWFPQARSAEEIATVTETNRLISTPYTKYMNSVMAVDQSASLIMMSASRARSLGVPEDRWVYFWGGGEATENPWFYSERSDLVDSPSMGHAGNSALAQAGIGAADIDMFDLYSCFPVAVELACARLGISEDDPRPFTVTGGLPYFGGAGNNYSTHAIAEVVQRLRREPEAKAMVTANGWYLTKHAAGVYSGRPRPQSGERPAELPAQTDGAAEPVTIAVEAEGAARLETHTVVYGRDGEPTQGVVIGRLEDDRRFLAFTPEDRDVMETLGSTDEVRLTGKVTHTTPHNVFTPS